MAYLSSESGIADYIKSVVPSDSADISPVGYCAGVYATTGGVLAVVCGERAAVNITVPDNFVLPLKIQRINATGTTATGIIAFMVD